MPTARDGCPRPEPLPPCPPCSLHDQPELLATILDAIGMALLNRGCLDAGGRFVIAARDIRLAHFGKKHPFTAASYNSYSRVLRNRDELIEAEKEVGKAIVINRKVYGSNGLPLAANLNELGAVRLYQGDFSGALKAAERGLAILKKCGVYRRRSEHQPPARRQGRALLGLGKLGPANTALSQAVKLDQKQVGVDHPKYATHRANLAIVQEAQKDLAAAEQGYWEAVRVYEQVLGRLGHPNLIDTYANLGYAADQDRQFRDREGLSLQGTGPEPAAARRRPHAGRQRSREPGPPLLRDRQQRGGVRAVQEGAGHLPGQRQAQAAAEEASVHRAKRRSG